MAHMLENPDRSLYLTLEAYAPAFVSEEGVEMMQRFRQELSGKNLPLSDVLRHVTSFLRSIGYERELSGKSLVLGEEDARKDEVARDGLQG